MIEGQIKFKDNVTGEQADEIIKTMLRSLDITQLEAVESTSMMQIIEMEK